MKKLGSYLVHENKNGYSSFPCIAKGYDGTLYTIFRYENKRRSKTHINTKSIAILKKSGDKGKTWEFVSDVKSRYKFCGIQDPSIHISKKDGTFILNYFVWGGREKHTKKSKNARVYGTNVLLSHDNGITWDFKSEKIISGGLTPMATSQPGAFLWSIRKDLLAIGAYGDTGGGGLASFFILSEDYGLSWERPIKIAHDLTGKIDFTEPAILEGSGDHILCLMRAETESGNEIYQAHSWNKGVTWEPYRKTPIKGFPPNLLRLENGYFLCTYGFRKKPYGIRACLSYDEGISWDTDNEIIIRKGGGGWDIGYPNTIQLTDKSLVTAYYFYTKKNKTRRIECTRWEL